MMPRTSRPARASRALPAEGAFKHDASVVLARLREALLQVLHRLPGPPRKPAQLARVLAIGATPAWQLFRLAHAADPIIEGFNVPGPAPMQRFLRAASRQQVPEALIREVDEAYQAFVRVVETHATDRRTFDSLISAFASPGTDPLSFQHKRAAYRSTSHLWGAQARTLLHCGIVHASAEAPETLVDAGNLQGYLSLRRFRPTVPLIIASTRPSDIHNPSFGLPQKYRREPLVPEAELTHGVPLLKEFCSQPLPELRMRRSESGDLLTELVPSGIGNESAVTTMAGTVQRNLPGPYLDETVPAIFTFVWVRIPSEVLISDLLLHRDFPRPLRADVSVFADRTRSSLAAPHAFTDADLLCVQESVVHLGTGTRVLATADLPRYVEMVELALERLGWDGREFEVYRCRVEYPIVQSVVRVNLHLPARPRR